MEPKGTFLLDTKITFALNNVEPSKNAFVQHAIVNIIL